jgi:hypothetical protein
MTEMQATSAASSDIEASPDASKPAVLHIVCDADVGLFNLVSGVIAHTHWAITERRIPIIYYGEKNCYWTPNGYRGRKTVWEYYFEPVIPEYPVSQIPPHVLKSIADNFPKRTDLGHFVDAFAFVSNHGAWHIGVDGEALRGPGAYKAPSRKIRELTSTIVRDYIRPRDYITEKADRFFHKYLADRYVIGVHIRGTDALVDPDRHVRLTRVNFRKYITVLRRLRRKNPDALIFVASDAQASVDRIRKAFGGVIAYDSTRHQGGEIAGRGPAGGIMPAYLTQDPDRAAKNGEEAVIEYVLLCRSDYLVHNCSSIPLTVLLTVPDMPETNIDEPSLLRRAGTAMRERLAVWRSRAKINTVIKVTNVCELPALPKFPCVPKRWDLIEGLNAKVVQGSAVVPGQRILRLVAAGTEGRHALGARFGDFAPGGVYRAIAWVKAGPRVRVMLETRDSVDSHTGQPSNYGVARFDLAARSVVNFYGNTIARGVDAAGDDWVKLWVDLRSRDGQLFVLMGLLEGRNNRYAFRAAGQSVIFGGFEISPHLIDATPEYNG